jgi:hypothetical protein
MNESDLFRVTAIAEETRKWAETVGRIEKLDVDLTGFCARGSARLFTNLTAAGYSPEIIVTHAADNRSAHVWVKLNGYIVDITASQFGHQDICVIECRPSRPWYWRETYILHGVRQLRELQKEQDWAKEQIVQRKDTKYA